MIPEQLKIKNTIKHPTSLLIGGLTSVGIEIAESLIEQGGYVIIVDTYTDKTLDQLDNFAKSSLVSFVDYTSLPHLDEEIRRLDYVFFFIKEVVDPTQKIPTQHFLNFSNYLDASLTLASKFDAKFLLATSIRAHQQIITAQENAAMLANTTQKHSVYTEMEVQRYAESLVMEYHERVSLDVRIVRVAEIVGDGVDFSIQTPFVELVMRAAAGKPLLLRKDGLETEWLVHLLDAAYGIIKALFSKNTSGQIFSIAYENPFTHLAIAYKIQEVEEGIQEIQFANESDNLPSLKLYKPAPNLSAVGWMPRIPFDKAVKQSVVAAKVYLLENKTKEVKGKQTIAEKLRTFASFAEPKIRTEDEDPDGLGPISKLIAERKRQEELRKQSMELANTSIKLKRRKKPRTFREKLEDKFWNFMLSLGKTFAFFKNRTPAEFGLIVFLIFVAGLFFFNIVAPVTVIARNLLSISSTYTQMTEKLMRGEYTTVATDASSMGNSITEVSQVLSNLKSPLSIVGLGPNVDSFQKTLNVYSKVLEGLRNIGESLDGYNRYLSEYQNNIQFRFSTESFLSVSNPGLDYSKMLGNLAEQYPFMDAGIAKIKSATSELGQIDLNLIPSFLADSVQKINSEIRTFSSSLDGLQSAKYLEELLGVQDPKTHLVVLLDNTRPKPAGGELSAFALISMQNGGISQITVQSFSEVNFDMSVITADILKQINLTRFTYRNALDVGIYDLANIRDFDQFADALKIVFGKTYGRKVDFVSSLNFTAFDALLKEVNEGVFSGSLSIEVNSTDIVKTGFLNGLKAAQPENASIQNRNLTAAQIFANFIYSINLRLKEALPVMLDASAQSVKNRDILISSTNQEFNKFVRANGYNGNTSANYPIFFTAGLSSDDPKYVGSDKIPSVTLAAETSITSAYLLGYKLNLRFPALTTSQEVSVCFPSQIQDSTITVTGVPQTRYAINSLSPVKCVVAKTVGETELTVTWQLSASALGKQEEENLAYYLSLVKPRGNSSTLDYKITFDKNLRIISLDPFVALQDNVAIFTKTLTGDFEMKIVFKK